MKQRILLFAFFSFTAFFSNAQIIVDFESETVGNMTFAVDSFMFISDGEFLISEFEDFSCDGSVGFNKYLDSGFMDAASMDTIGTIRPVNTEVVFQVSTSMEQCVWVGSDDGDVISTGVIGFTGTNLDGGVVYEEFEVESLNFNDLVPITFTAATWADIDLTSLQVEIVSTSDSTDYFAMDNLVLEKVAMLTSTDEFTAQQIKVSPNPTTGAITLSNFEQGQIVITDSFGRKVKEVFMSSPALDISELANGFYFLSIQVRDKIYTKRIVKI